MASQSEQIKKQKREQKAAEEWIKKELERIRGKQ